MIVDQHVTVAASPEQVWRFVMDIPAVSRCLPGAESVSPLDGNSYRGALRLKVGPVALRLEGTITLREQDPAALRARLDLQAADRRLGGAVNGQLQLQLQPHADQQTDLVIHADVAVLGKLGEFGQAVLRRKADQMVREFAQNLSRAIAAQPPTA